MNWYHELGVDRDASPVTIRQAYRQKALILHPDKQGNAESFARLNEAFTILSDPDRRADYDKQFRKRPRSDQTEKRAFFATKLNHSKQIKRSSSGLHRSELVVDWSVNGKKFSSVREARDYIDMHGGHLNAPHFETEYSDEYVEYTLQRIRRRTASDSKHSS